MSDFFEIDFLDVESSKSGDAITLRYTDNGIQFVHVVDAGFQDTGESVVGHIRKYYDNPVFIDHVVCSHPDGDHAGGLRTVLEEFPVGTLWMLRPWLYADILIEQFTRFTSVSNLIRRLKDTYPNIAALEEIAQDKNIPIKEPFQDAYIGPFLVLSPTLPQYLGLVVESDKTPESKQEQAQFGLGISKLAQVLQEVKAVVRAAWGVESFSSESPSAENEMSVVQYANLCGQRILLTADAGPRALQEAADYLEDKGVSLPGIDRFQVPHHGSRRNVNTEILDRWLGKRQTEHLGEGKEYFTAFISSAKKDEHHPKKAVVRAMYHRGGRVITTEGRTVCTGKNSPQRAGWGPVKSVPYPWEQEV